MDPSKKYSDLLTIYRYHVIVRIYHDISLTAEAQCLNFKSSSIGMTMIKTLIWIIIGISGSISRARWVVTVPLAAVLEGAMALSDTVLVRVDANASAGAILSLSSWN